MSEEREDIERDDELDLEEELEDEDETVDEPEPPPPAAAPEPQPRPSGRADRRIAAQQAKIREQDAELARLRALAAQAQQYQAPPPDPERQSRLEREELERVAQLPFEEQGRYWSRKVQEETRREMLQQGLQTRDMLDRMQFENVMRTRKLPAKYATEVDNLLIQARQQGMNPSREWLLNAVVGRELLERKDKEVARQRQNGAARIARQQVRPAGTGNTAGSGGGRRSRSQDADDEALLRGITVGDFISNTGA
jgi:hypothetical protein